MFTRPLFSVLACAVVAGCVAGCMAGSLAGSMTAATAAPWVRPDAGPLARRPILLAAGRRAPAETEAVGDLPGRYAVMRDKRDTGCMLTLDRARVKGGARAQLAPGCRDQGIVIFDPSTWAVIKGELVLTARAGHKARLMNEGVGAWKKAPKDGKPLGLNKL